MTFIAFAVALCTPDREWAAEQRALQMMANKGATVRIYTTGVQVDFSGTETPTTFFTACGGELRRTLTPSGKAADFSDADFHLFAPIRQLLQLNLKGTNVSIDSKHALMRSRRTCKITF